MRRFVVTAVSAEDIWKNLTGEMAIPSRVACDLASTGWYFTPDPSVSVSCEYPACVHRKSEYSHSTRAAQRHVPLRANGGLGESIYNSYSAHAYAIRGRFPSEQRWIPTLRQPALLSCNKPEGRVGLLERWLAVARPSILADRDIAVTASLRI